MLSLLTQGTRHANCDRGQQDRQGERAGPDRDGDGGLDGLGEWLRGEQRHAEQEHQPDLQRVAAPGEV